MNDRYEQEIRLRLLKMLDRESNIGQRDMAKRIGNSLGKVNYCISELTKKGLIKIKRYKSARKKVPYTYIITPRGLKEKARLTVHFLRVKISEYKEIKCQIRDLVSEIDEEKLACISTLKILQSL